MQGVGTNALEKLYFEASYAFKRDLQLKSGKKVVYFVSGIF